MMSRLKKIADRPRENRKKVSFALKLSLEVDNSDGDAINDLRKFKDWTTNIFTEWDKSILEYFLYQYGLLQNESSDKYFLDFRIDRLLDDDTNDEHISYKEESNKEENNDEDNDK